MNQKSGHREQETKSQISKNQNLKYSNPIPNKSETELRESQLIRPEVKNQKKETLISSRVPRNKKESSAQKKELAQMQQSSANSKIADKDASNIKTIDIKMQYEELKIVHTNLRENYKTLKEKYYKISKSKQIYEAIIDTATRMRNIFDMYEKMNFFDLKAFKSIDFKLFDDHLRGLNIPKPSKIEESDSSFKQGASISKDDTGFEKFQKTPHLKSKIDVQLSNYLDPEIVDEKIKDRILPTKNQSNQNQGSDIEVTLFDNQIEADSQRLKSINQQLILKVGRMTSTIDSLEESLKQKQIDIDNTVEKYENILQLQKEEARLRLESVSSNFAQEIRNITQKFSTNSKPENIRGDQKREADYQQTIIQLFQARKKIETLLQEIHQSEEIKKELRNETEILQAKIQKYAEKYDRLITEQRLNASRLMATEIQKSALQLSGFQGIRPEKIDPITREIRVTKEDYQKWQQQISSYADLEIKLDQIKLINLNMNDRIEDLEKERDELVKSKNALLLDLDAKRTIDSVRKSQKNEFENSIKELLFQIAGQKEVIQSQKQSIEEAARMIQTKDEEVNNLRAQIKSMEVQNKILALDISEKLKEIQEIGENRAHLQKENRKVMENVLVLESDLRKEKEECTSIKLAYQMQQTKTQDLLKEQVNYQIEKELLQSTILKLENQMAELQKATELKDERVIGLTSEVGNLYQEIEKLQKMMHSKKEKLQTQIKNSYKPVDRSDDHLSDQVSLLNYLMTIKEKEIEDQKTSLQNNEAELQKLKTETIKMAVNNAALQQELKKSLSDLEGMQKYKNAFENIEQSVLGNRDTHLRLEEGMQKIQLLEEKIIKLGYESDRLKLELSQKSMSLSKKEEEFEKIKTAFEYSEERLKTIENENRSLTSELADKARLKSMNDSNEIEIATLKQDLASLLIKLPEKESKITAEQIQIKLLEKELSKQELLNKDLRERVNTKENEILLNRNEFESEKEEKNRQIQKLETRISNMKKTYQGSEDFDKLLTDRDSQIFQMAKISNQRKDEFNRLREKNDLLVNENAMLKIKIGKFESGLSLKNQDSTKIDQLADTPLRDFRLKYKIESENFDSAKELLILYQLLEEVHKKLYEFNNHSDIHKKSNELMLKVNILENEIRTQNSTITKQKDNIGSLEYKLNNVNRKCLGLEAERDELTAKLEAKKKDYLNAASGLKNAQFIVSQKEEQLLTLRETMNDFNKMIALKDEAYKNLQELYNQYYFDETAIKNNLKIVHFKLEDQITENGRLQSEIERLKKSLFDLQTDFLKREEDLMLKLNLVHGTKEEARQTLNNEAAKLIELTQTNIRIENELKSLSGQLEKAKKTESSWEKKCEALLRVARFELEELPQLDEYAQLKLENERLLAENETLRSYNARKVMELEREIEELKKAIKNNELLAQKSNMKNRIEMANPPNQTPLLSNTRTQELEKNTDLHRNSINELEIQLADQQKLIDFDSQIAGNQKSKSSILKNQASNLILLKYDKNQQNAELNSGIEKVGDQKTRIIELLGQFQNQMKVLGQYVDSLNLLLNPSKTRPVIGPEAINQTGIGVISDNQTIQIVMDDLIQRINELKSSLESAISEVSQILKRQAELEIQTVNLKAQMNDLQINKVEFDEKFFSIMAGKELKSLEFQGALEVIGNQISMDKATWSQREKCLTQQMDKLNAKVDELLTIQTKLEQERSEFQAHCNSQKNELIQLTLVIQNLESEKANLTEKLYSEFVSNELNKNIASQNINLVNQISNETIEEWEKRKFVLESENQKSGFEILRLKNEIIELKKTINGDSNQINRLQKLTETHERKSTSLEEKMIEDVANETYKILEIEVIKNEQNEREFSLIEKIAILKTEVENLTFALKKANNSIEMMRITKDDSLGAINTLQLMVDEYKSTVQVLEKEKLELGGLIMGHINRVQKFITVLKELGLDSEFQTHNGDPNNSNVYKSERIEMEIEVIGNGELLNITKLKTESEKIVTAIEKIKSAWKNVYDKNVLLSNNNKMLKEIMENQQVVLNERMYSNVIGTELKLREIDALEEQTEEKLIDWRKKESQFRKETGKLTEIIAELMENKKNFLVQEMEFRETIRLLKKTVLEMEYEKQKRGMDSNISQFNLKNTEIKGVIEKIEDSDDKNEESWRFKASTLKKNVEILEISIKELSEKLTKLEIEKIKSEEEIGKFVKVIANMEEEKIKQEERFFSNLARDELANRKIIAEIGLIEDQTIAKDQQHLNLEASLRSEIQNLRNQLKIAQENYEKLEQGLIDQFSKARTEILFLETAIAVSEEEKAIFSKEVLKNETKANAKISELEQKLRMQEIPYFGKMIEEKSKPGNHPENLETLMQSKSIKEGSPNLIDQIQTLNQEYQDMKSKMEGLNLIATQIEFNIKDQFNTSVSENFKHDILHMNEPGQVDQTSTPQTLEEKFEIIQNQRDELRKKIGDIELKLRVLQENADKFAPLDIKKISVTQKSRRDAVLKSESTIKILKSKIEDKKMDLSEVPEIVNQSNVLRDYELDAFNELLKETQDANENLKEMVLSLENENLKLMAKIYELEVVMAILSNEN